MMIEIVWAEKKFRVIAAALIRSLLTILWFSLATSIIPPAANTATLQEDSACMISTNACADLCKDILRIRRRRRLTYIILSKAFCCPIGTETACKGVPGRYLQSNSKEYVREWCLDEDGWSVDQRNARRKRHTHMDEYSTRRSRLSIIISTPTMNFAISCRGTCVLHSTADLVIVITSIERAGSSISSFLIHSLGMMKVGKFLSRHGIFKFLDWSRRMVDFTPTSCLSANLETARKESSGRNVREDKSWWRRSLAVIVLPPAFDWAAFLIAAATRNPITMRDGAGVEWARGDDNLLILGGWWMVLGRWRRVDATSLE